jgi:hypothetical protein
MRKLEGSLASLRSAAREHAEERRRQGGARADGLRLGRSRDAGVSLVAAAPKATWFRFVNRAIARLRLIGRKLLRAR